MINSTDVDLATAFVMEEEIPTAAQFIAADINQDGLVNSVDVEMITDRAQ